MQNPHRLFHSSELIKNKTLEFFSKALPILQADESLPKVAKSAEGAYYGNPNNNR